MKKILFSIKLSPLFFLGKNVGLNFLEYGILLRFVINCADNSGAKPLKIFFAEKIQAALNRLPLASV